MLSVSEQISTSEIDSWHSGLCHDIGKLWYITQGYSAVPAAVSCTYLYGIFLGAWHYYNVVPSAALIMLIMQHVFCLRKLILVNLADRSTKGSYALCIVYVLVHIIYVSANPLQCDSLVPKNMNGG